MILSDVHAPDVSLRIESAPIHYVTDFGFLAGAYVVWNGRDGCYEWCGPAVSGLDIETEGVLSPYDGEIATVQVELGGQCWVVHWDADLTLTQVKDVDLFRFYLECKNVTKIIHNASFEQKFFLHAFGAGLTLEPVHDTMAAEYVLAEGSGFSELRMGNDMSSLRLDAIVLRRYQVEMDKDKELRTGFRRAGSVSIVPAAKKGGVSFCQHCTDFAEFTNGSGKAKKLVCTLHLGEYPRVSKWAPINAADYQEDVITTYELNERQIRYAAFDSLWATQIAQDQLRDISRMNPTKAAQYRELVKLDSAAAEAIARMELAGMPIDKEALEVLDAEWRFALEYLNEDIQEELYEDGDAERVNLNSGQQMVPKLANFGIQIPSYETAELKRYKGHPLADKIVELKQITKLQGTYSSSFLAKINPKSKRIHCNFNQFLTTTGRLSSSGPNLQNLPARTPLGREIRKCVVAPKGKVFVICDYSQIELRLIAEMYGCEAMIRAFVEGKDLHAMMGAQILGEPYEHFVSRVLLGDERYKDARGSGKPANFGLGYGAGVQQLITIAWTQYDIAWTYDEANRIRNAYLELWSGVAAYHKRVGREIENGQGPYCVETQDGRVRKMPRHWQDPKTFKRKSCYSAALNHPIQGTSADMIKKAMVQLCRQFQLILQVHDELVFEVDEADAEWALYVIKETMKEIGQTYLKRLPVDADAKISKTWSK
jgi:DNA polymerase I-like protein with 3'-5' exonuclease and polymerase domains